MQQQSHSRIFVLGIFIIVSSLINFTSPTEATAQSTIPLTAADIIAVTNTARTLNGLAPLATSTLLTHSAQTKANTMLAQGYFAHTNPEGAHFWTLIRAVGYTYTLAGENLAIGFSSDDEIIKAWLNSPAHRDNILNPEYKEIGIGLAYGEYQNRYQWFVVQHLGSTGN